MIDLVKDNFNGLPFLLANFWSKLPPSQYSIKMLYWTALSLWRFDLWIVKNLTTQLWFNFFTIFISFFIASIIFCSCSSFWTISNCLKATSWSNSTILPRYTLPSPPDPRNWWISIVVLLIPPSVSPCPIVPSSSFFLINLACFIWLLDGVFFLEGFFWTLFSSWVVALSKLQSLSESAFFLDSSILLTESKVSFFDPWLLVDSSMSILKIKAYHCLFQIHKIWEP